VVPDIFKVQNTFISNSWAGQDGYSTGWYLKLKAVWSFKIWDLLTHWQCRISEESYLLKVLPDNLSDTLHRRPSSQMIGLFCLFKAWMQTSSTAVRNARGIMERVSDMPYLAAICL
jgi:hypothetical protein